jgi:hypothetical protein
VPAPAISAPSPEASAARHHLADGVNAERKGAMHGLTRLGAGAGIDPRKAVHRNLNVAAAARIK